MQPTLRHVRLSLPFEILWALSWSASALIIGGAIAVLWNDGLGPVLLLLGLGFPAGLIQAKLVPASVARPCAWTLATTVGSAIGVFVGGFVIGFAGLFVVATGPPSLLRDVIWVVASLVGGGIGGLIVGFAQCVARPEERPYKGILEEGRWIRTSGWAGILFIGSLIIGSLILAALAVALAPLRAAPPAVILSGPVLGAAIYGLIMGITLKRIAKATATFPPS